MDKHVLNKYELAQYNHSNIQELIRFIDQKAGAILVIHGFILTAFIEFAKKLEFVNPFEEKNILLSLATFVCGVLTLSLLIYQIYVILFEIIKPKKAKHYTQEESSVLYFEHISKLSKSDFITLYHSLPDDRVHEELLAQVYECSCIMSSKSEKLNHVIKYLFVTLMFLLVFIFLTKLI
ncbi:hypothetical protein BO219_11480 [Anoxybacillus kestanbolensis]|uniref:Pycsar effector protein domain-containing protein n=1 Tax=Anoxybacillus kestanbolensis TaxID=227476 RepID=A0A1V3FIA2_9BACL|nr:hypothetical protein [Anoxybacillus kestanbolensis]OOE01326.1 hypothetical protein BO219_11480 [Anoxybacillus kestanbolensis]